MTRFQTESRSEVLGGAVPAPTPTPPPPPPPPPIPTPPPRTPSTEAPAPVSFRRSPLASLPLLPFPLPPPPRPPHLHRCYPQPAAPRQLLLPERGGAGRPRVGQLISQQPRPPPVGRGHLLTADDYNIFAGIAIERRLPRGGRGEDCPALYT